MSNGNKVIQERFSASSANYASSPLHAQGEDLGWLLEATQLSGQERVLDIGTGTGNAAFTFAPHVASVEGIDITPSMLAQAEIGAEERGFNNIRFSIGNAQQIPREDATYDLVVSRWCAHHYQNIRQACAEIARVLKPEGQFLLIDACVPSQARLDTFINSLEMLRDTGHVRNYSIREWLEFLETVGLHGEVLHEWAIPLDGESWVERIQTPKVYIAAIQALLEEADDDLRQTLQISTGENWGFHLPAVLIRAIRH